MTIDVKPTPLSISQQLTVSGTRMFIGAFVGAIRLFRGQPPSAWRTVRYGLHREEILDYMPAQPNVKVRAPVVFFHGGGWMMGTKDFYSQDLVFLAAAGHPVFNVEYPKAPEHPHPWILRSVLKALFFICRSFPEARAVHLAGDSAGGNLAVMAGLLSANPELLRAVDPLCSPVALPKPISVTSLYGVLDRASCMAPDVPTGRTIIESYGGPGALEDVVDAAHSITPMDLKFTNHPPCFLLCGEQDVLLPSTELYAARLKAEGRAVTVKTYAGANHGFFNFPEGGAKRPSQRDIIDFLKEVDA